MKSRDVRIVEAGRAFGLFLEAATIEGIRPQMGREPLESDGALQASVLRPVHFPHASFAQPLANHKAAYRFPGKRPGHLAVRALRRVFWHGKDPRYLLTRQAYRRTPINVPMALSWATSLRRRMLLYGLRAGKSGAECSYSLIIQRGCAELMALLGT